MKSGKWLKRELYLSITLLFFVIANAGATNYTLTVNAGTKGAAWNRFYEQCVASCHAYTILHSAYGRNISNALKKAHAEAGFQYLRCHGILDDDVAPYKSAGTYDWTNLDAIYDSVVAAGMRPEVEISFMPTALINSTSKASFSPWYNNKTPVAGPPSNWTTWGNFITALVQHLETKYGAAEVRNNWYFEIWNEPDWMYTGLTDYLTLYDNTVKAIGAADPQIRVGGPAQSGPSSLNSIATLVSHCKSSGSKLDFVSWHRYSNDNGYSGSLANANSISDFAKAIVDQIKSSGFTGLSICDEWGPDYNTPVQRDNEVSASFAAKAIHLLTLNGANYPPPIMFGWWTISDIYEEINVGTQTAFRSGNYGMLLKGDAAVPASWDLAKPVFNAFKLLHKLGSYTLTCSGGTTSDGVNAAATISATNDTIDVLVYDHYNGGTASATTADNVQLTVSGIPFANARVEHWVVDHTHSNAYTAWTGMQSPAQPISSQWTTLANAAQLQHYDSVATQTITGGTFTKSFTQNYYSVGLIQITSTSPIKVSDPKKEQTITHIVEMNAFVLDKSIVMILPHSGNYKINLYTTGGRKETSLNFTGPGTSSFSLARVPAGAYMLECSGPAQKLVKPVVVGR